MIRYGTSNPYVSVRSRTVLYVWDTQECHLMLRAVTSCCPLDLALGSGVLDPTALGTAAVSCELRRGSRSLKANAATARHYLSLLLQPCLSPLGIHNSHKSVRGGL